MHSNESMHHHQTWTPHHPSPNTPILPLPPKMTPNSSRSRPTLNRHPLNKRALAFPSAATLPTESFPRLATQFLPTDFLLALHRASSVHGPLTVPLPYWLPRGILSCPLRVGLRGSNLLAQKSPCTKNQTNKKVRGWVGESFLLFLFLCLFGRSLEPRAVICDSSRLSPAHLRMRSGSGAPRFLFLYDAAPTPE